MQTAHAQQQQSGLWTRFSLLISCVILLFIFVIFLGLFKNNTRLIEAEIVSRARARFNSIVLTRHWNAMFGGVYVEKKAGVVSNPYLEDPDIESTDGRVFTKKNSSLMTREISELAAQAEDHPFRFHITSLNPLNPDNAPDAFERAALQNFEQGAQEIFGKQTRNGKTFFRYMGPLFVEEQCLPCHAKQGYELDQVRGGISVMFDIDDVEKTLQKQRNVLIILCVAILITILAMIYFFFIGLTRKLSRAQGKIHELAVTDELTRLYNRRHFFTCMADELRRAKRHGHALSFLIMDIDHFKKINDNYGHLAGDKVLRGLTDLLQTHCRKTDILARYSGEEFVQLLPETGIEGGIHVAEEIRALVEANPIKIDEETILQVTVSIGFVGFTGDQIQHFENIDDIIRMAEIALYRAKEKGRNRVESAKSDEEQA